MAEKIKKAKTIIEPKKPAATKAISEKPTATKDITSKITKEKPVAKNAASKKALVPKVEAGRIGIAAVKAVSQQEVAVLAHRFWAERGYQHGRHVEDWFRAEQELRGRAS